VERLHSLLVIRLSSLGDVLFALPAVQALIASGRAERVSWLVEDRAAGLLSGVAGLHEVVVFPRREPGRWLTHALAMRRRRDDAVLDMQGTLKTRVQLGLLRSPRKLGFDSSLARDGAELALTERIQPPSWAHHRVEQGLALLAALDLKAPRRAARPVIAVTPEAAERAASFIERLPGQGPTVVLHPGTSAFGSLKRWPPEHYAALGAALSRSVGARLVINAGPGDEPQVAAVRAALRVPATPVPPGSLRDLTALMSAADLVVASDSLPLHLANALGTPVVGLYGPKDPAVTGPYFDRATVVRAGVACSPCTLRRCGDRICMQQLQVDEVEAAALSLMQEPHA
jgi:ADP-heptose:LPS heptosyltransferase